jgi:hypothetical protein
MPLHAGYGVRFSSGYWMVMGFEKNLARVNLRPFKSGIIISHLKLTTKAVTTRLSKTRGKGPQPNFMIWSYLSLGNVPLTHMNIKTRTNTFIKNHTKPGRYGPNQPPRKSVVPRAATAVRWVYSAIKKSANFMLLYSI